ncbi:MAG: hypothetical protein JSS02_18025 [Planctomycetes bacterium]|nr:hypothetical protein [Planctomycetota bacterium]
MATIGFILTGLGSLAWFIGYIWLVVLAFQKSALWGIGSFCVPIVGWVYAFQNWEQGKKPFLIEIVGVVLSLVGGALTGGGAAARNQ